MKLYAAATVALFLLAAIQTTPTAAEEQESTSEAISEPPIKLVHVLNPGEREYLSPNLIGVQNIAMTFLPLSMNFVNIIDAFREIVDGVRYEILLNAVDTKAKDADTICRLVILEKPWLTTQWGDKHRELVNTNCSDVADNVLAVDSEDRAKALNDKYVSNTIFNGGRRNELSDSEMARLEAQILTNDNKRRISSSSSISTTSTTTSATAVPPQAVPTNEPITSINVNEAAAASTADVESDTGDANTSTATPTPIAMTTPTAELNENEKRWLDDILSVAAFNFEKTIEEQRTELKQQQQQQQEQQREETTQAEEVEQQKEPVDEEQEQIDQEQQQHQQQEQLEQDAQQSSLS